MESLDLYKNAIHEFIYFRMEFLKDFPIHWIYIYIWLLEGQRHSSMITVFISINKILGSNTSTAKKGRMRDSLRERDFEVQKR